MSEHMWTRFAGAAQHNAERVALRSRHGSTWEFDALTFAELVDLVDTKARAVLERGVAHGDRVAILAHNSREWLEADLTLLSIGAVPVPIYPSSTPEQVRHILGDSGSVIVIVEDQEQLDKVQQVRDQLPELRHVVAFAEIESVLSYGALAPQDPASEQQLQERRSQLAADDVATIIYTSGTTGDPKGAVLSHGAFTAEFEALDAKFTITPGEDHSLSFLPLSHALERAWSHHVLGHGCMVTVVDDPKQIADYLRLVRPTLFVSVPRLYDKIYQRVMEQVGDSTAKKGVLRWALRVGGQMQRAYRKGRQPSLFWRAQLPMADMLVLRSIRDAIGGPKTAMATGGAPVPKHLEEFFSAVGILLMNGYGMTECAPLMTFNAPGDFKFGTVGRVMKGGAIKIGPDSEIWYRGPNVMQGYWNNEEATRETLDAEGWIHTGDVGYVDVDGYLVVTDRKKDILITSGGKNVAPQPIEGQILADPLFEYAVLLGNDRPFLTAILRPSLPDLERLAREMQIRFSSVEELVDNERLQEEVRKRMEKLSEKLPRHEQIKDFRLTFDDFTQENGLLTPTLKVKRREVEAQFKEKIDEMYAKLADKRRRG